MGGKERVTGWSEEALDKPPCFASRLVVGGCDDVDQFVLRHDANVMKATAALHNMITTWLHFYDMRKTKTSDMITQIRTDLTSARVDLAVSATKGACGTSLDARVQEIKQLEAEYERLQLKVNS